MAKKEVETIKVPHGIQKGKSIYLLISLVALLLLYPLLEGDNIGSLLLTIITSVIIITSVYSLSYTKKTLIWAMSIGSATLLATWIDFFVRNPSWDLVSIILWILFYAFAVIALLFHVLSSTDVTIDTLYGAVSIYLLVAVLWGAIYTLIEGLSPGSFFINPGHNIDGLRTWSDFFYYSLVTLTTLGYGDITPVTASARSFSVMEAIIGILYIAVLVARLVGLYHPTKKN